MNLILIKRLKLILEIILLEDIELLEAQILKLKSYESAFQIYEIIKEIENGSYGNAARLIEEYISVAKGVQVYEYPEVSALRIEIKFLEQQLTEQISQKMEIEKQIHHFNIRYQQELGYLIKELLRLRKERLEKKAEKSPEKRDEFEEAFDDYESYQRFYHESIEKNLIELTSEENKELKDIFRKSCRLCHPDVISDEFKNEAQDFFIRLKDAYEHNDLNRVKKIFHDLMQGKIPDKGFDSITDKQRLRIVITRLKGDIQAIKDHIQDLKQSEAYQTFSNLDDWEFYFSEIKIKLECEIEFMKD